MAEVIDLASSDTDCEIIDDPNLTHVDSASSDTDCEIIDNPSHDHELTQVPNITKVCSLCEEMGLIKTLSHCSVCEEYFHGECAAEYGDNMKCWVCDLNGMIGEDENETLDREEVKDMFSALRSTKDESIGDDCEMADEDDMVDIEQDVSSDSIPMITDETKSARRWKQFLENSTAKFDEDFEEITNRIKQELQDDEKKSIYSMGFSQVA